MGVSNESHTKEPTNDFVDHLRQRLGVSQEEAIAILITWVSHYQPRASRSASRGCPEKRLGEQSEGATTTRKS